MPVIDRYWLRLLTGTFGFFALVLVSVYWLNRAISLFERLLADGQTARVVLEFTALTLPAVIALVLPVAAFAAAATATHRLAGESELAAMQAAGLSPWRLARPVAVFGLLVALMVAGLAHGLVPAARAQLAARQAAVTENLAARLVRPGAFQYPAPGITLYLRTTTPEGEMRDLLLEDARDPARPVLYTAESASLLRGPDGARLQMRDGMAQALGPDGRLGVTRFAALDYALGGLAGADAPRSDLRDWGTAALWRGDPQVLAATGASAAEARLRAHQRLAQPLLAPVAAMLGFALLMLGGFSRFGVGRQVLLAVVALVALQFLTTAAEGRAGSDPARAWPLVYAPALIGAAACAAVLAFAGRARRPVPAS